MRISVKSFLLSFGIALLLFSVVMACICTDIFRARVTVDKTEKNASGFPTLNTPIRPACEIRLFYCNNKEDTSLDFAVLVRIDTVGKRLLVTPVDGSLLLEREDSLYYVRTVCDTHGTDGLAAALGAVTGYTATEQGVFNVRDYLPETLKKGTVRYPDFREVLPQMWQKENLLYDIVEIPLVTKENNNLKIISAEATLAAFRKFEIQ